jgi:hypothetical protein
MLREKIILLPSTAERLGSCDECIFNRQFTRINGINPRRFCCDFARTSKPQKVSASVAQHCIHPGSSTVHVSDLLRRINLRP